MADDDGGALVSTPFHEMLVFSQGGSKACEVALGVLDDLSVDGGFRERMM